MLRNIFKRTSHKRHGYFTKLANPSKKSLTPYMINPKSLKLDQKKIFRTFSKKNKNENEDMEKSNDIFRAIDIPFSPVLSNFLLFADKDPKKNDKDDKKKKDEENDFMKFLNDFDPNNFFNENKDKLLIILAMLAGLFAYYLSDIREILNLYPSTTFQELATKINEGQVSRIKIQKIVDEYDYRYQAVIILNDGSREIIQLGNVDSFTENLEKLQTGVTNSSPSTEEAFNQLINSSSFASIESMIPIEFENIRSPIRYASKAFSIGSSLAIIAFFLYMLKSSRNMDLSATGLSGTSGFMKSNAKKFTVENKVKTKFKDVAGLAQAKLEITEFVDFLKKPERYRKLGAKIPRGALLSGPPGTGKTLLAKACAGEAGVTFLYTSGSEFVEMFVGVGASRVRDLFKEAKENAPAIIFIDEIDAIGKKRENSVNSGSDERDSTLNQLLVELDGFSTDTEVVVFAATNRKELLDNALIRTGRFDRSIEVTLPDLEGRNEIFNVHLEPLKLSDERTIEKYAKRLATLTPGFSGADIANICNEAAILAARNNRESVTPHDFEMAVERVIGGLEQKRIVSDDERKTVAVHESGHAVVSWFLEGGDPLLKLTIIPRSKGSLGFAQYLPNETSLETKENLLDKICKILGGRVAEEEFFEQVTTGAYDDLNKAYDMARNLVTKVGMSEKIGYVNFSENEYGMKTYSDATNRIIDEEVKRIIDECTQKTRELVKEKRAEIQALSDLLLEKETIDLKQIVGVLGERPFEAKSTYKAYLEELTNEEEEKQQEVKGATA